MSADGDMEIDPEIAAAMGFSGFGQQPNKKRKFNREDGFVDPNVARHANGTGANNSALGERKSTKSKSEIPGNQSSGKEKQTVSMHNGSTSAPEFASLEALRHGIRNERGDLVYFLPSFIEDPWAKLRSRG